MRRAYSRGDCAPRPRVLDRVVAASQGPMAHVVRPAGPHRKARGTGSFPRRAGRCLNTEEELVWTVPAVLVVDGVRGSKGIGPAALRRAPGMLCRGGSSSNLGWGVESRPEGRAPSKQNVNYA